MADLASFDKPDPTSNHSNEVFETLRANVRAAAALQPGSRTNPGVGALFRSSPAAGELLLEEATNTAGTSKATVFDSRTKLSTSGGTVSGQTVLRNGDGTYSLRVESVTTGAGIRYRTQDSGGFRRVAVDFTNDGSGITSDVQVFEGDRVGFGGRPDASARLHLWSGGTGNFRALFGDAASSGNGAPGGWATAESLGARGDGNGTFFGRFGAAFRRTDGTAVASGAVLGGYLFGAQHGTGTSFASGSLRYAAGMFGVARGSFTGAAAMPTAILFRTGSAGDDILAANASYGTDSMEITEGGDVRLLRSAPKLIHRTGGQDVAELSFALSGAAVNRGEIALVSRRSDGTVAVTALQVDGYSDGSTGVGVYAHNAAGSVLAQIIANANAAGQNTYQCGTGARHAFSGGNVEPTTDNALSLGATGQRWSAVWAANGTIQTSDARDKADLEGIDPAAAAHFISLLAPVTFRWLIGGRRIVQVEDGHDERAVEVQETYTATELQPVTEPVEVTEQREVLAVEDGRAVVRVVAETRTELRPVGTWVPVVDAAGQPVMEPTGEEQETGRGKNRRKVPVLRQRQHFVPTLAEVQVERNRTVTRIERIPRYRQEAVDEAGRRFHAGFIAQDVRAALTAAGLDRNAQALGLWVSADPRDPEAEQSLRPDQFIPFLVAAWQHLAQRLTALEAR